MENNFVGHRKFIFSILALITNTCLVAFSKIDPGVYSVVAVATIGAYITGNVVQNLGQNQKKDTQ